MGLLAACSSEQSHTRLVLAATTSIEDSGLLDVLVAEFTKAHPQIQVSAVAVGTGQAIELARHGDADVVISHDSTAELKLVADGIASERWSVMHNYFVIAGPPSDPVGARGHDAVDALRRIAERRALFVSRGDDSGTHRKEVGLWRAAGLDPSRADGQWYVEASVGMGDALLLAGQKQAYLLTDRGTYLRFAQRTGLAVICDQDPRLLNSYGVTVVKGERAAAATAFADWITSDAAQRLIGSFGVAEFGESLFTPSQVPAITSGL